MKNRTVILMSLCCIILTACGGAVEPAPVAPEPEKIFAAPPRLVTPEPEPPSGPPKATQRVNATDQRKCDVFEQEDGTQMVMAQEHDWFVYVSANAEIECGTFGGNVTITDSGVQQIIKPLVPEGVSGVEAEKFLREQATGFVRSGLQSEYGGGRDLKFDEMKLGKSKRPALCADSEFDMKGMPGRVVACVTSKTNVNDEVVVHRAVWVGDASAYDAKATPRLVQEAATGWFRYSDTDGFGKLLHKW